SAGDVSAAAAGATASLPAAAGFEAAPAFDSTAGLDAAAGFDAGFDSAAGFGSALPVRAGFASVDLRPRAPRPEAASAGAASFAGRVSVGVGAGCEEAVADAALARELGTDWPSSSGGGAAPTARPREPRRIPI